jgi:AcrR family transcriptional regulator
VAKSPTEQVRELVLELKVLTERDENRRRELERVAVKAEATQAEVAVLRQENAVLRQQHQDHIKQTELQDSRRWGLFIALAGVLLGAVLSLASGLIVTLARK